MSYVSSVWRDYVSQVQLPWRVCHYPCRLVEVRTIFQKLCIPHWLIPLAHSPCYRRSGRWSQYWTLGDHENNPDCLDKGRRFLGTWWLKDQMRKSRLLRFSVFHRVYSFNSWQNSHCLSSMRYLLKQCVSMSAQVFAIRGYLWVFYASLQKHTKTVKEMEEKREANYPRVWRVHARCISESGPG